MNKGDDYEGKVKKLIEKELASGRLGIDPSIAKIKPKPKYFSRDRNSNITFDISLEVTRKGMNAPWYTIIWECKNYSKPVPIDDAEEFHAKLCQVGVNGKKGIMISPIGFASGVMEYAHAKGLGLWRWVARGSIVSLMENSHQPTTADIKRAIELADTTAFRSFSDVYGQTTDGQYIVDAARLLRHEIETD